MQRDSGGVVGGSRTGQGKQRRRGSARRWLRRVSGAVRQQRRNRGSARGTAGRADHGLSGAAAALPGSRRLPVRRRRDVDLGDGDAAFSEQKRRVSARRKRGVAVRCRRWRRCRHDDSRSSHTGAVNDGSRVVRRISGETDGGAARWSRNRRTAADAGGEW